jgi:integrase/recombinase XerD
MEAPEQQRAPVPKPGGGGPPGYFGKARRKPPEVLTHDELRDILAVIEGPQKHRDRAIIMLLYHHAMRASELCGLEWGGWYRRKQDDWMVHTIHSEARELLCKHRIAVRAKHLKLRPVSPETPMFLSKRGQALTQNGLWRMVNKWMRRAGIEASKCHPHTFRHSKATNMLKAGADVTMVQRYLGHASPRTTAETYLHPDAKAVHDAAELDALYPPHPF